MEADYEKLLISQETLRVLNAKHCDLMDWHKEFFDRVNAEQPDFVSEILKKMGTE